MLGRGGLPYKENNQIQLRNSTTLVWEVPLPELVMRIKKPISHRSEDLSGRCGQRTDVEDLWIVGGEGVPRSVVIGVGEVTRGRQRGVHGAEG